MRVPRELVRRIAAMDRGRRLIAIAVALVLAAASTAGTIHLALQPKVEAAEPLAAYVPQGALMAVESPDFAALLVAWTNSEEEKAWVRSDNYAQFSRSRLFSRLGEAQSEFAASAGLAPDAKFLAQVAGGESFFAWYDIGKLEFLYLTRMKPGEAANNPLMKLADRFQMRRAGADSFYIRSEADRGGANGLESRGDGTGGARTVAFAVHGDLLLLATREDLIANALLLAQHQGDATLRNEPWYLAANSAVSARKGAAGPDLTMTLNLARIVPSPYFRSYWVQRNVTEMKQYSAAVSDLYRTRGEFHEERVLIPKSPDVSMAAGDLSPVLRYLPEDSGVYRAVAKPGTAEIVNQLDRRLISREAEPYRDSRIAPAADLSNAGAGSGGDLDSRIDEQPVPELPLASALGSLRGLIDAVRPTAMLVYSSRQAGGAESVFVPIHSAAVLEASVPWDTEAVQVAFVEALRPRLTVGRVGLSWRRREQDGESWIELTGLQPMAMAVRGGALIVATDSETLLRMMRSAKSGGRLRSEYTNASIVAGFSHSGEREGLGRLSALLDGHHALPGGNSGSPTDSPPFFSGNMGSLSGALRSLDSETFFEGPTENHEVRQTVVYRWRP